jgi:hypothetical protein
MAHQAFPSTYDAPSPGEATALPVGSTVAQVERDLVLQTLASCNGNRTHAARVLGVSVRTLRNRIRLYAARGIEVPAHGSPTGRRGLTDLPEIRLTLLRERLERFAGFLR